MDKHSIKVPQLYKFASKIASKYAAGEGSIKYLVYQVHHPNIKGIYSLVTTTFQHSNEIDYLIEKSQLLTKESVNPWLARILITELLWGKKRLGGESKPIKTVLSFKDILIESLNEYHNGNDANKINNISPAPNSFLPVAKPRYVRINTLKVHTEDIITTLQNEGWKFQRKPADTYDEFLSRIINLQKDEFTLDYHVPNMLIFAKKTQFYDVAAYKKSEIILQDKASCLAVHLLDPKPGSRVLDMCAAPGFKTTHIAALMEDKGQVYAVDLNENRFRTMNQLIINIGAECIKTSCCDVLTITDKNCPDVEYILVDPSCSGSGITDRECINEKEDENRLAKLANFQAMILRHALTTFPKAKRVVYSTCSIHPKENEAVVQEVIQRCKDFKLVNLKTLMQDKWINFGKSEFGEIGERCLRAVPEIDHTNGFFVAVFERLKPNESNEFFVKTIAKVIETNHIDIACQSGKKNSKKGKKSILKKKVSKSKMKKIGVQNNVDGQNDNINSNGGNNDNSVFSNKDTIEKSILNDKDSQGVKKQKKKKNSVVRVRSNIKDQNNKININNDKKNENFVFSNKNKEKSSLNNQDSQSVTSKNKMKKKKKNSIGGIQNEDNNKSSVEIEGTDNKLEKNSNSDGKSDTNTSSEEIIKETKRKTKKSTSEEDESAKKRKTIEAIKDNTEITDNENIKNTKKRKTNKTCETIEETENKGNEEEIEESNDKDQSHWVFSEDDDDYFEFVEQRTMFLT